MPKEWTGNLVGLMHNKGITNIRLAEKLGVTDRYVSMVLNSKREPPGAEERFTHAVKELIQEHTQDTTQNVQ